MQLLTIEIVCPITTTLLEVEWAEIEGPTGSFTITAGHAPLVSLITESFITIKFSDECQAQRHMLASDLAVIHVNDSMARILCCASVGGEL